MTRTSAGRRGATIVVAAAAVITLALASSAAAAPEDFGLDSVSASVSTDQAGAHPDFTTTIAIKQDPSTPVNAFGLHLPYASPRDITVKLPAGLTGNPNAVAHCTVEQFSTFSDPGGGCPNNSQVGLSRVLTYDQPRPFLEPVYMMQPPGGDVVARLGFVAGIAPTYIDFQLDPARGYAINAVVRDASTLARLLEADTTVWAVPADPSHDTERQTIREAFNGETSSVPRPPGGPPVAFMSNPTSCGMPAPVVFSVDSYELPDLISTMSAPLPALLGCEAIQFNPDVHLAPTSAVASAPSGMDFDLEIPQDTLTAPGGLRASDLKKAVVTLPAGMTLNPAAADGLEGCTTAQIGLVSKSPVQFDGSEPSCPDASKIGTVEVDTPLLEERLEGAVYQAAQNDNPFDALLTGYIVAKGPGVLLKLAGRFDLDPRTGQIVASFDNNPQQPFSEFKLHFKAGNHGVLVMPKRCGRYTSQIVLTPWSGTPDSHLSDSFDVTSNCDAFGQFSPAVNAGIANPAAGASSAFTFQLTRQGGQENIAGLTTTLPPGLLASVKGIPQCDDAHAATGDCPTESQVGSTTVATGSGPDPLYIPQAGKAPTAVYLGGPYKGAPFSLVIKVPAQAGPFDLGTVAVRAALFIDPRDAHVTVVSDPLPQIIQGIPLSYRDIRVTVDRPGFMRAPTSCDPMQISADVIPAAADPQIQLQGQIGYAGATGDAVHLTNRFQVGGCQALEFKPKLTLKLTGKRQTTDGKHPGVHATVAQAAGQANIRSASVALPLSLALDPLNSQHVCPKPVADAVHGGAVGCPASTKVGTATAVTPLLPHPLVADVYLVQGIRTNKFGHQVRTLPTLLVPLRGADNVALDLRAQSAVVKNKLVTTFGTVPDAPITSFTLNITGGRKGILVVTHHQNVCRGRQLASGAFTGQNGKVEPLHVGLAVRSICGRRHHKKRK